MSRLPRAFVAVALAAVPVGLLTLALMLGARLDPGPLTRVVFELVLAWGFVVCGLWMLALGRSRWFGYLSVAAGCAFFVECWRFSSVPFFYTAGLLFGSLWGAVLFHMIMAFPSGRLRSRLERWLVGYGYFFSLV